MIAVAATLVIVKWFVEEEFSTQALRLRDDQVEQRVRVVVPALAGYEVLNALRYSGSFGAESSSRSRGPWMDISSWRWA